MTSKLPCEIRSDKAPGAFVESMPDPLQVVARRDATPFMKHPYKQTASAEEADAVFISNGETLDRPVTSGNGWIADRLSALTDILNNNDLNSRRAVSPAL